ncbi:hypothetical protein SARC_14189, partial [Sphaeroforma arctica JP610]
MKMSMDDDTMVGDATTADDVQLTTAEHVERLLQYIATSGDKLSEGQQFSQ